MEFQKFFIFSLFLCFAFNLHAQNIKIDADAGIDENGANASISISIGDDKNNSNNSEKQPLPFPKEYRGVQLGMQIDDVKQKLKEDSLYGYRGERDVSLLPTENRVLIESSGDSFLSRSWFQFYEEKLYTMTFKLDEDRVDFYSLFSSLQEKYGEPTSLDPEKIVWKDDTVTLSLERPLVLKYIDTQVFDEIKKSSSVKKTTEELTRKGFLESL